MELVELNFVRGSEDPEVLIVAARDFTWPHHLNQVWACRIYIFCHF